MGRPFLHCPLQLCRGTSSISHLPMKGRLPFFFFFYFEFCFYDNNTLPSVGRKEIDFYIGSRGQDSYVA